MKFNNYPSKVLSQLGIFKTIGVLLLCLGFQTSHAQDSCETAVPITAGTITVAAINGVNTITTCSTVAMAEWYSYTPTQNYSVTITSDLPQNICGDTRFNVYTGNCGALVCYSGDDDSGIIACNSGNASTFLSKKTFDVTAGTKYYIAWDNRWSAAGFDFQLTEAPFVPSPCSTAIPVTAGITTVDAIDGSNVTTGCSTALKGKWYSYVPSQNYHLTISSDLPANLCKDTNFSVYTGSCSGTLTCVVSDDNSGVLNCDTSSDSFLSKKTFDVVGGTTYYIAWDNKWSSTGFDFEITEAEIIIPINYNSQTVATINSTYNICIVDMNGDHKDDVVGVTGNSMKVHYQTDNGTLSAPTTFAVPGTTFDPSWSLAAGDLNKDGFNDLLLGSGSGLSFWTSNDSGTAYTCTTPGQFIFCQRTNFVDINNDGNLDAFSCHDIDPNVYYINEGPGTYTYYQSGVTPGAYSLGIIPNGGNYASLWTDIDNDGDVDMFISKCSGPPCELHRNDGAAGFTDISAIAQINQTPVQSWSSAIADFDVDGDMDILVGSNGNTGHKYYRNNLDTTNETEEAFTNITAGSGWDTDTTMNRDYVAYDFDNDGYEDVLSANNRIMFNKGDGTFEKAPYANLSIGAVGDLNEDGFLDILNGSTIRYGVPNGNNWIKVALQGIQSNSNGIGARVEIYGDWGKQIRDIRSGIGFEFMSSLNAHFGIGTATTVNKVIIRWPSGLVDTINNPARNQTLVVTEGVTLATGSFNTADFTVFPNPVKNTLNIKWNSKAHSIKSSEVFDLNGRLVLNPTVTNESISVESLSQGTYILLLKDQSGKTYTQKFIKE